MSDRTVEFFGETLKITEPSEYEFALMEFAAAADDIEADSLAGLAAVMGVLRAIICEDDWKRFRTLARKNHAQIERDLMPLVVEAFEQETDRPTGRPSDSPDGPPPTNEPSVGDSSSRVIDRLEKQGRPDIALVVAQAQAYRASA